MLFLIIMLTIISIIVISYYLIKVKLKNLSKQFFGTSDYMTAIKKLELENENTPKTLMGMESLHLPKIQKDFKDLNPNELKSLCEQNILTALNAINEKDNRIFNDKVNSWIKQKINNNIVYENIKIHKTIIERYEKNDSVATIYFQTSLEYFQNNKKVQDRLQTEYIYIIDETKLEKNTKYIVLNCKNCGAPIRNINKHCPYCGSETIDLIKKTWVFNNIKQK